MKTRLLPVLLLAALSACGTDPNAARTTSSDTASPTEAATSSTPSADQPSTPTASATATASASVTPTAAVTAAIPASSTGVPTGSVVTLPGDGVVFSSSAQIYATSWMGADAKTFLASALTSLQSQSGSCSTLTVSGYRVPDLMNGSAFACNGGGYMVLWGKTSSGWKEVLGAQGVPQCSEVHATGWTGTIPKSFVGGQCSEGGTVVDYKP